MAAIRHRVKIRMFLASRWEDITSRTRQSDTITITRGRKDENTKTPPSPCTLTLDNSDGAFSLRNPLGPWYGTLGRNNPIEISKNLATDTFSRTVPSGLGTSDTGQTWSTLSGSVTTSVALSGAVLTLTPGAINQVYLPSVVQADVSVTAEFSIATADITGDVVVPGGVFVRGTTAPEHVYARIVVGTDESITLGLNSASGATYVAATATGITHVSGQRLGVRILADGDTIAAKLWRAADGEPLEWLVTATGRTKARGFVGIRTALGTSSTNNPTLVTYYSFVADSVRFTGELSRLPAASDDSGRDQYAPLESAGILRRLGQGRAPTQSAIRRGILSVNPVAYWPCEDGADATEISSAIAGVQPMAIGPAPTLPNFEANDEFLCSAPIPEMNGTSWVGTLPNYDTSAGEVQARVLISTPVGGSPADEVMIRIASQGTAAIWDLVQEPDGQMRVNVYDANGAPIYVGGSISFDNNGKNLRVSFSLRQVGANVEWTASVLEPGSSGVGFFSDTVVGVTFGRCTFVAVNALRTFTDVAMGHVSFQNDVTDLFEIKAQLDAHVGERALTRMRRLSTENSVPFVFVGVESDTAPMGAQRVKTYLDLVRESGDADVGTVHERRGFLAVGYRTRTSVLAQSSAVTLDLSKFEVGTPFRPVDDDQGTRNDRLVRRAGGGEYRAVLEAGPMSVLDPPDGVGRYDDETTLSLQADSQLYDHGNWLLGLGTVNEARYPRLKIDLDAPAVIAAGLESTVLDLDIDDRISIINAQRSRIYEPVHQLVRGYTEVLGNFVHTVTPNLSPSFPFDTGVLDDGINRVGSGSSALTNDLAEGVTGAVSVSTSVAADLWTTSAGDFPLDIMVGGERITLSAISGATSPQTFTISARAVNGVAKGHDAGAPVNVADPWRLGL